MRGALQRGSHLVRMQQHAANTTHSSTVLASIRPAAACFHSAPCAAAAPAAKPAPAAAAGKAAAPGAKSAPLTGPPAVDSARWVAEGWGADKSLVPEVRPAVKSAEEAAADAAELAASLVLPELHATIRDQTGSKHSQWLRRQRLRIPGIVTDRDNPRQNQLRIEIDRFELEQLCRKYRRSVGHRVCLLHVEGMDAPLKVIPEEIQRHAVTQELQVANFFLFQPFKHAIKVNIPIVYTGAEECLGVKRGGVLVILHDKIPCVWKGGDNIPPFIHINLTNADGGKVFRNDDFHLPEGLRLQNPGKDYAVATVLGHKTKDRGEEEEPAAGAAAAPVVQQVSAIQLEKEKKAKERKEEEEMVAQKLAQAKAKK